MKPQLALLCSLILVSILSTIAWKYSERGSSEYTFVQEAIGHQAPKKVNESEASTTTKTLSTTNDEFEALLSEAGRAGEGGPLALPNPIGAKIAGIIQEVKQVDRAVFEVAGRLTAPREGWFLLRKHRKPGRAGTIVGLIDIVSEDRVIELSTNGIVSRVREDVVCVGLPSVDIEKARELEENDNYVPGAFLASVLPGVDVNSIPIPPYQNGIVPLQSLRGAAAVAYLDYDGESVSSWGGVEAAGYNMTPEEMLEVRERVSEDYAPFTINVTTDEAVYLAADESSRIRCIVTPTTDASPGSGGVAYLV